MALLSKPGRQPRGAGRSYRTIVPAALALLAWIPEEARAADDRAVFLVKLFIAACVPNMGRPDEVRVWAAQKHLGEIHDAAPLALFVGPGVNGAAWAVPTQFGSFALSIRGLTAACSVWAQRADAGEVEVEFKKLVQGVARPGLRIRADRDSTTPTAVGRARALVYNIIAPGAPSGYEFTMVTAERAGGGFQASLQVAKAKAD